MTSPVKTTCPYCGVGCGVLVTPLDDGTIAVKGDPDHPANFGRLCSKGSALDETIGLEDRLLEPNINGAPASWEQATQTIATRLQEIRAQHGPQAIAFYVSGQLLTEDYYVANKLMKGFIGANNIDTNSRLCMSSAVAGYKRAFGSDTVPGSYEDLERAKLIVLVGSNTAWCHPVTFQRILKAKKDNPDMMIVVIDPRRTPTCDVADLHLPLQPGTDATLFNGLLTYLDQQGESNPVFLQHQVEGLAEALQLAKATAPNIQEVASLTGLSEALVKEFYRLFARTERVVTLFSQGLNQSSSGTDKINSIINCHLFTGRMGRAGMGPFSITGQPNAMGGREVGGLANQLAAHMEIDNPAHRQLLQAFWQSPLISDQEGLKAVDLFQAIAEQKIKAVWIMATNPAVSMPNAAAVRAALQQCELVIVSDCMDKTDTLEYAHIRLPALTWGERDGMVTNSERCMSRQRSFLPAPGQAKADWEILTLVAKAMGFGAAFPYQTPRDILCEFAQLSAFQNQGSRDFDISAYSHLSNEEYDQLPPRQWPITAAAPQGTKRMFVDGRFFTASGKARMIGISPKLPTHLPNLQFPFVLNTGRVRDHWHTLTRTGKSPRLSAHKVEPYVEIHPDDAKKKNIHQGMLVNVFNAQGSVVVRAQVDENQQRGSLFVPMHWNAQFSSRARVDDLVFAVVDPYSGQPESKHAIADICEYQPAWHGFLLSRRRLPVKANYWALTRGEGIWRYEIAGDEAPDSWGRCAREILCTSEKDVGWSEYFDTAATRYRAARLVNNRLESCIFIEREFHLPSREYLASLFQKEQISNPERMSLLSGKALSGVDHGPVVCACFSVGKNQILQAIAKNGLTTPEQIGDALKAGTNCGSCVPELRKLLAESGKE